jgi:P27 family predicted phage terminase small subunit
VIEMGRRGPAPQSQTLKLLRGNPGKRPLKKQRAAPTTTSKVSCPDWLSPAAKAEWRRVAPELARMGLLTGLDRAALAAYCQNYAVWVECSRFLHEHGEMYLTPRGQLLKWPLAETARKAEQSMRAFAGEFGLTPGSRLRLNVEGQEVPEDDPFEEWLNRRC